MSRQFVYAFLNPYNTVSVVNYNATNNIVNTFLSAFDVWGGCGMSKVSHDGVSIERWFECDKEIWNMLHTHVFEVAFARMGVKLAFEYPYMNELSNAKE